MKNELGLSIPKLAEGSILRTLGQDSFARSKILDSLATNTVIQREMDRMRKSVDLFGGQFHKNILGGLDQSILRQGLFRDVAGPIERMRMESALHQTAIAKFINQTGSSVALAGINKLNIEHAKTLAAFKSWNSSTGQIGKAISDSMRLLDKNRLDAIAKPFQNIESVLGLNASISNFHKLTINRPEWAIKFGSPVIDSAATMAIAGLWGQDGIQKQLRSFGIDYERLIEGFADEGQDADEQDMAPRANAGRLSFSDYLSIFSILLAILVPIWQKIDSDQTEVRLTGEIRDATAKQVERIAILEGLLEKALKAIQPHERGEVMYVVRARVAQIRETPESGSKILAEIFPNQVVTLVREKGKWIEVEYFDWVEQEPRQGWVLKKYLIRV